MSFTEACSCKYLSAYVVEAVLKFDKCCEAAARAVESNGNFVFMAAAISAVTDYWTDI